MKPVYVGYTAPVNRVGPEIWLVQGDIILARMMTEGDHPHVAVCWLQEQLADGSHAGMRGNDGQIVIYRQAPTGRGYWRRGHA